MKHRSYESSHATKQAISASLKALMVQKPLDKITVSEIMDHCGMVRQHFYYHFEDIYDLVRWMFQEEAVSLLQRQEGVLLWQEGLLPAVSVPSGKPGCLPVRTEFPEPQPPEAPLLYGSLRHHPPHRHYCGR